MCCAELGLLTNRYIYGNIFQGKFSEMPNSSPIKSLVRTISTRSERKKSDPDRGTRLSLHSEGDSMHSSNQDGTQYERSIDLESQEQDSHTQDSPKSSRSPPKYNTRNLRNLVQTVSVSPKGKAEQSQKTVPRRIMLVKNNTSTQAQSSCQVKRHVRSNTGINRNINVLHKKQTVMEEREGSKDDSSRKMSTNKSKDPVLGTSTPALSSKRKGETIVIDNLSISPVSSSLHDHNKQRKGDLEHKSGDKLDLEVNTQTPPSKKMKVVSSSEKVATNLVEQVACFKCKFCLFLSLSQDAVTLHVQQEHAFPLSGENNSSMRCPGCSNVFFSHKSLKVHLSEDHNVASEELENILKVISSNISKKHAPQNSQKGSFKIEKQLQKDVNNTTGNSQSSPAASEIDSQNLEVGITRQQSDIQSTTFINATEEIKTSKSVEKENAAQISLVDPLSPDETCKIRVRQLSFLEKAQKEKREDELMEIPAENSDVSRSEISFVTDCHENSSFPQFHLIECQSETNTGENIQMNIQYDFESMQILDVPLEHQQSDPKEQLVQQIHLGNSDTVKSLEAIDVVDASRYCTIAASPTSCEAIIDEICQEEGLDHMLYVEQEDLTDGRDSPLMVCFASPADNENEEGHHIEIETNDSTSSVNGNKDNDGHDCERMVLSNCTFNGTGLVGTDGKKLVKRGFVRRAASKKRKPRLLHSHQRHSILDTYGDDSDSNTFKCSFSGCTVRLYSHENMEYHKKCHVPDGSLEEEEEGLSTSKRGRSLLRKTKFDCPECSAEVQTWKQMKGHLWKFHSIDMELYTCDQCGYKTPSLSIMRNFHEKIHGTEKPFLCDTCGKGYKTVKQLRNHKVVHVQGVSVHSCEICGRIFHTNRMLKNHINTVHNKVRPYMCSECGHTAANRSSLKMHLRQHTGDRPYKCDHCEYRTADHNSLRRHKKRHTGDKPYKCTYCSYACIQSSTFKTHLRRKHPGQDSGLVFNCKKCPFHTVSHDIYLAHTAEHGMAEACGIPFKTSRPQRKRTRRIEKEYESPSEEMPIFVSIATDDATTDSESPNFEKIVQHVSEAILPGSNLHVLYNSISFSHAYSKKSDTNHPSNSISHHDPMVEIADDDASELELVAEVNDADAMVEMPSEMEFKLKCDKSQN